MTALLLAVLAGQPAYAAEPVPDAWIAAYDATRKALVEDRDADAVAQARALAALVDPELAPLAGKVADAADAAARRTAFGDLSRALVTRISSAGGPRVLAYYCPMITTGYAYWLQPTAGIGNPYMGTSMPGCGEQTSLKAAAKAAAK